MKKAILSVLLALPFISARAQVVNDTVSIGATYANQVWYSLANDNQGSAPKNNWDLAFDVSGMGASVMINSVIGTKLWKYPAADTAGWAAVDTAGLSTWATHWNSDTSWALGAMGNYADLSNPYDLDWGVYNIITHVVTGDSLYIIQLGSGEYKKLWIESLSGSVYTFKYANLDGTGLQTATLDKAAYTSKNFGYYSLHTNSAIDREPLSASWDLVFTQYTGFVPVPYTVSGVLANKNVQVTKCADIADVSSYTSYASATFGTAINTIGYDWKTFTGTAYEVQDSLLYFVRSVDGDIWKVIFTGFGGSSTGNYMFSKQRLVSTVVADIAGNASSLAVYPNPSNGQFVKIIYSFPVTEASAMLTVSDISGKAVLTTALDMTSGLHQYSLAAQSLQPGMYIANIIAAGNRMQQKFIIQ